MTNEVSIMSISLLAEKLGVSARTVKRHIEKVEDKYAIAVTLKRGSHVLIKPEYENLVIASIQGLDLPSDPSTPVSVVMPTEEPKQVVEVAEFVDEPNEASLSLAPVRSPDVALARRDWEAYDRATDSHLAAIARNFATMDKALTIVAEEKAKETLAKMNYTFAQTIASGLAGMAEDVAA